MPRCIYVYNRDDNHDVRDLDDPQSRRWERSNYKLPESSCDLELHPLWLLHMPFVSSVLRDRGRITRTHISRVNIQPERRQFHRYCDAVDSDRRRLQLCHMFKSIWSWWLSFRACLWQKAYFPYSVHQTLAKSSEKLSNLSIHRYSLITTILRL